MRTLALCNILLGAHLAQVFAQDESIELQYCKYPSGSTPSFQ
jgi:hypothetical protein